MVVVLKVVHSKVQCRAIYGSIGGSVIMNRLCPYGSLLTNLLNFKKNHHRNIVCSVFSKNPHKSSQPYVSYFAPKDYWMPMGAVVFVSVIFSLSSNHMCQMHYELCPLCISLSEY